MNNKLTDEALSAYLDGELPPAQHKEVQRRIEASPAAQAQLEELRKLSGLIQELPRQQLPQEFADQVLQLAERRSLLAEPAPLPASHSQMSWWRPALGVSVAAAAVFALTTLLPQVNVPDNGKELENLAQRTEQSEPTTSPAAPADRAVRLGKATGDKDSSESFEAVVPVKSKSLKSDEVGSPKVQIADSAERRQAKPGKDLEVKNGTRLKLPADQEWNRERIGEIIHAVTVDKSGSRVAVIEVAVVDIQKWVWGVEVLLQKGPLKETQTESDVVAVYVKASEDAVTDALAQLHTDGVKLLGMEMREPIEIAELPSQQQQQFFDYQGIGLASEGNGKKQSLLTSRLDPPTLRPVEPEKELADKATEAEVQPGNSKGKAAEPAVRRRSSKMRSQLARIAENIFVPRASSRIRSGEKQDIAEEQLGVVRPVPPAEESVDELDPKADQPKMVRIIFLVQRATDSPTIPTQQHKPTTGGGGAA